MGWDWLHKVFCVCCLCFFASAQAALTIHIQSPWRNDATKSSYKLHILGSTTSYNPIYEAGSNTKMKSEGNGWFSYTWDKNVSDFQDWQNFDVKLCPDSSDNNYNNNHCEAWTDSAGKALAFKPVSLFGSDNELWLYTNADGSFSKSYMAPGSKIVWFKSPWGNKALPRMIFGADSVMMRFAVDDSSKCGWFYGALTPAMLKSNAVKSAYFDRLYANYLAVPMEGTVDLSKALASNDTIYVDGTVAIPTASAKIGTLGVCFDSTKTLHVYHPWRSNTSYRDSALYISVGNNIVNNPKAMDSTGEDRYWWHYDFETTITSKQEWNSAGATVDFYRRQNEWPQVSYFLHSTKPTISSFFPTGVYETWVFASTSIDGRIDMTFAPLEKKTVRLMSPWDDMTPSMLVNGDTVKMGSFSKDTCGWYQAAYYKHVAEWNVTFKQTFGFAIYTASGTKDGESISLDSIFALSDTAWVMPYPTSSSKPQLHTTFPGRLGICPTMQISAMLVDWAGESHPDSIDVDFGGIYDGNAYTEVTFLDSAGKLTTNRKCGGHVMGMVKPILGPSGLPERVDSLDYPWGKCSAAHEIEKWFVPETLAVDAAGRKYTNAACRDIDLTLDEEGFWLADITEAGNCNDPVNPGFYPLDDFEYLDSAKTIKNPKFDWAVSGCMHNYSFSMKISAQFQYVKGQYFEFRGDDDVWVFIDNRLVVDIGGCHSPVEGAVNLDTLGLIEGETYPFRIFFSERNATGSNFKMRTSINLETEKTYYPVEIPTKDGTISYEIWQMLVDKSLSCDISSVAKVDTIPAASLFILMGPGLSEEGDTLGPGVNFGGITISETMSGFIIDTAAVVRSRTLAPGSYTLYFYLESDLSQSSKIYFTVPEYPLPTIVFADTLWNEMNPDTVRLGQYAFIPYAVNVMAVYMGTPCDSGCDGVLKFSSKDSLALADASGGLLDSIEVKNGRATFYVMGTAAVENGAFSLSSPAYDNILTWSKINLEKPPVPIPNGGWMRDRDGDGVADSLVLSYGEAIVDDNAPDSVQWQFGDSTWHKENRKSVESHRYLDSLLVFEKDSLLNFLFTGNTSNSIYAGSYTSIFHKTVTDTLTGATDTLEFKVSGKIHDKIGPVITNAIVTPRSESVYQLAIVFSEAIDTNQVAFDSVFEFKAWRNGSESSHQIYPVSGNRKTSRYEVFYSNKNGVLPTVGDSIRIAPGILKDLSQNAAAENNRWVRIVGEQYITVESATVFNADNEKLMEFEDSLTVIPYKVALGLPYETAEKNIGLPGFLIRFDLGELAAAQGASAESLYVKYEANFYTNLGVYMNSSSGKLSCTDAIFSGDCIQNSGNIYLAWNVRSNKGRIAGTGAYIAKLKIKIGVLGGDSQKKEVTRSWGIRRIKK
ncbi:MAG: fibro-slime domain-containing protein [Hallerella porci]|uniref:fibro-slime domain-containing protein n=1 Tax=Hallerella porci TaxID=1945871 RepID=UPI002A7F7B0B|nr:fibro-slime domain-containing protein [Hallerella porci]MDY3921777.1 fibro-slime domain-containing protein [Hallerella porci]